MLPFSPSKPSPSRGGNTFSSPQRGEVGRGALSEENEEPATETPGKKLFMPTPVPVPLLEAARSLRKNMTDAEKLLWTFLRRKQLGGFRFRRQHPFEQYVLDFFCYEAMLAVELDGGQHNASDTHLRDKERTIFLNHHGIQVVRFWNHEVISNLEDVLQSIYDLLQQSTQREDKP